MYTVGLDASVSISILSNLYSNFSMNFSSIQSVQLFQVFISLSESPNYTLDQIKEIPPSGGNRLLWSRFLWEVF
jgi:hypothetical protein